MPFYLLHWFFHFIPLIHALHFILHSNSFFTLFHSSFISYSMHFYLLYSFFHFLLTFSCSSFHSSFKFILYFIPFFISFFNAFLFNIFILPFHFTFYALHSILLMQFFSCNSSHAILLMQFFSCNSSHAILLMQFFSCNSSHSTWWERIHKSITIILYLYIYKHPMNNKLSKLLLRGTIHEATLLKSETPSITMANHFFNEVSKFAKCCTEWFWKRF